MHEERRAPRPAVESLLSESSLAADKQSSSRWEPPKRETLSEGSDAQRGPRFPPPGRPSHLARPSSAEVHPEANTWSPTAVRHRERQRHGASWAKTCARKVELPEKWLSRKSVESFRRACRHRRPWRGSIRDVAIGDGVIRDLAAAAAADLPRRDGRVRVGAGQVAACRVARLQWPSGSTPPGGAQRTARCSRRRVADMGIELGPLSESSLRPAGCRPYARRLSASYRAPKRTGTAC